jgi:hypothetical protein
MLTQEDLVAPKMSAEGTLQRSSWKAEAIRRGDLKISGPFPITEVLPLNENEEKAYAEKTQIESVVQPAEPSPTSNPPPPLPVLPASEVAIPRSEMANADAPAATEEAEVNHMLKHKVSSDSLRPKGEVQATNPPPMATYSSPTPFSAVPRTSTIADSKKKRKGSLRNVFRKMFGKKAREDNAGDVVSRHSHHRSVRTHDPMFVGGY